MCISFNKAALEFGGIDILVSNAGIASAAPLEDTTLELWNRNQSILATGYFLVGREGFHTVGRELIPIDLNSGQGRRQSDCAQKLGLRNQDVAEVACIPGLISDRDVRVHVVFHGCRQAAQAIKDQFVREAGYNRWAETNRIVILYPQAVSRWWSIVTYGIEPSQRTRRPRKSAR